VPFLDDVDSEGRGTVGAQRPVGLSSVILRSSMAMWLGWDTQPTDPDVGDHSGVGSSGRSPRIVGPSLAGDEVGDQGIEERRPSLTCGHVSAHLATFHACLEIALERVT
jgi:hypothetical protein